MTKILLRDNYRSRYLHWEARRIEQMGFVNNLLIGLASVLLFWLCQGALEGKITLAVTSFWLVLISGVSLLLSLLFGLCLASNRLSDFRKTAELIRLENDRAYYKKLNRIAEVDEFDTKISQRKEANILLGISSWRLLNAQGIFFGIGLILLGVGTILNIIGL